MEAVEPYFNVSYKRNKEFWSVPAVALCPPA